MSEGEQRVTHVRGLKPNVTFEVEKESEDGRNIYLPDEAVGGQN
jgi:hypothetical protein